ncbi:MAG TPA: hemolysin III family protein [Candidatus Marinimicrobia bacterium]|jgi:hemolysin III|nr:hemolysin III family protein [Candidatus Neomarinimicrobiota bacterium]MDP6261547.1 hemolysin III family protein [Candidatus Neomarinimicrobiota bacterium]MDP7127714.1 hemolysin III family protein [Candidatus Neomarinimicrobiota bacterium]MDP7336972.1 hemolysin III family protein [Candidatus Neomarinimicrobiota bacterium]MDP7475709.1 hemolysin III family protein [Candidatus Neomarinimicrobiota bacterium]|tara:strand:- start:36 stop:698 length:663 start_codon:yes stop_codon:yes gene_type:complete
MENDHKSITKEFFAEELINSITHGIGSVLSIVALVLMVVYASYNSDAWSIVGVSIFGTTLILLYMSSTLYHAFSNGRVKQIFKTLDQSFIYLLIAGTYTPVLLITLRNTLGWTVFGLVWAMAIGGIIHRIFFFDKLKRLSLVSYIVMGWLSLIVFKSLLNAAPAELVVWLLIGGAFYTGGLIFYSWEKLPFNHAIWHLFVLGGSFSHFMGIYIYLIPSVG